MKRSACVALLLFAACGDDGASNVDAANEVDAAVDAPIDAPPPPRYSGRITVLETSQLNSGNVVPPVGQGLQVRVSFTDREALPAPTREEMPGVEVGCKAWEYTAAQAAAELIGLDEGSVAVSFVAGSAPTTPPVVPPCSFNAAAGYLCPHPATDIAGGAIAFSGGQGTLTLTGMTPFTDANSLGSYIRISGAAQSGNNGVFPITARPSTSAVRYTNASAVNETLPATATHVNLAGVGFIPAKADPGFLADDSMLVVDHTMGGGGHIPDFSLRTMAPGHVGDDFTVDAVTLALMRTITTSGQAMTFVCETGCAGFNAPASQIDLITTDAPLAGVPAFALPPPVTKRLHIRCIAPASPMVTVPAEYAALLAGAGATRIQATFTRATTVTRPAAGITVVTGHAITAFTTP